MACSRSVRSGLRDCIITGDANTLRDCTNCRVVGDRNRIFGSGNILEGNDNRATGVGNCIASGNGNELRDDATPLSLFPSPPPPRRRPRTRSSGLQRASEVAARYLMDASLGRLPLEEFIVDDDEEDDGDDEEEEYNGGDDDDEEDDVVVGDDSGDLTMLLPARSRRGRPLRQPTEFMQQSIVTSSWRRRSRSPIAATNRVAPAPWPGEPKQRGATQSECCVCKERGVCTVCQPCGHSCLCNSCAVEVGAQGLKCPMCQRRLRRIQRIFPS